MSAGVVPSEVERAALGDTVELGNWHLTLQHPDTRPWPCHWGLSSNEVICGSGPQGVMQGTGNDWLGFQDLVHPRMPPEHTQSSREALWNHAGFDLFNLFLKIFSEFSVHQSYPSVLTSASGFGVRGAGRWNPSRTVQPSCTLKQRHPPQTVQAVKGRPLGQF